MIAFWSFMSHLWHYSVFWGFLVKSGKCQNGTKMVRMTQYLVEKYCSIKIYQKSHQTIKKKEFGVLPFFGILSKQSSENVDCKIGGQWGQQRPTGDLTDHSGINSQPSLNRICHQIKMYGIFSFCQCQITFYSLSRNTL